MPLGMEIDLGPGYIVLDGEASPQRKKAQQPPTFRAMYMVAKRSPISATALGSFLSPTANDNSQ